MKLVHFEGGSDGPDRCRRRRGSIDVKECYIMNTQFSSIVVHVVYYFELHLQRLSFHGGFHHAWVKWLSVDECKPVHFDAFV